MLHVKCVLFTKILNLDKNYSYFTLYSEVLTHDTCKFTKQVFSFVHLCVCVCTIYVPIHRNYDYVCIRRCKDACHFMLDCTFLEIISSIFIRFHLFLDQDLPKSIKLINFIILLDIHSLTLTLTPHITIVQNPVKNENQ